MFRPFQFSIPANGEVYLVSFVTKRGHSRVFVASRSGPAGIILEKALGEKNDFCFRVILSAINRQLVTPFISRVESGERNLFSGALEETIIATAGSPFSRKNMNGLNARDPVTAIGGARRSPFITYDLWRPTQNGDIAQSGCPAPIYLRYQQDCALYGTLRAPWAVEETCNFLFSIDTPGFRRACFSGNYADYERRKVYNRSYVP